MKHTLFIILFCIPFLISAQNKTHIELNYGFHKNNLILQLEDESFQDYLNLRELEKGQYNPSVFLGLTHKINKSISVKSGFEVQILEYEVTSNGSDLKGKALRRNVLSIPVLAKLSLQTNKSWRPYFETGLVYSLVFNELQKQPEINELETLPGYTALRDLNYDPTLFQLANNIGLVKELRRGSEIFFQVSTTFQLDRIRQQGISERMYNIGGNIGLRVPIKMKSVSLEK